MTPPRDRQLLILALALLAVGSALLALAIDALRQPRISFPLLPRAIAPTP